jgi:hypothetical protein
MTTIASFSRLENALIPRFRESMSRAESTADVQKFFVYTILDLLNNALADAGGDLELLYEDVWLMPEEGAKPGYGLSPRLTAHAALTALMAGSDLPAILARFAETAGRRFRYLAQKPEKTEAKMYHGTGQAAK